MAAFWKPNCGLFILKNLNSVENGVNFTIRRKKNNFGPSTLRFMEATKHKTRRMVSDAESIAARGFLRPLKPYQPSVDVEDQIDDICRRQLSSTSNATKIDDLNTRFKIFKACEVITNHSIPNSSLYEILTIADLKRFYSTPIGTDTPYEQLKKMELPKNLHIQSDYHRYHPDTETLFNGKTAFPQSSTLVTGLKYRKKYQGHIQEFPTHKY